MNPASPPPLRLAEIADRLGGALEGDPDLLIGGVAEPAEAGAEDIVILADKRRLRDLESSPAAAVVVGGPWEVGKPAVRVRDARLALAELLEHFQFYIYDIVSLMQFLNLQLCCLHHILHVFQKMIFCMLRMLQELYE